MVDPENGWQSPIQHTIILHNFDNIGELFKVMFQSESHTLKDITRREDKRYPIAYGLSQFCKDCFLEDEKKSDSDFTLHYM